jgi:hypothetical protein
MAKRCVSEGIGGGGASGDGGGRKDANTGVQSATSWSEKNADTSDDDDKDCKKDDHLAAAVVANMEFLM